MLNPGIDLLHEGLESLLNEILTVHTVDCQVVACALRELLLGLAGPPGNVADTDWVSQGVTLAETGDRRNTEQLADQQQAGSTPAIIQLVTSQAAKAQG